MSSGIHCDGPACNTWAFYDMANNSGFMTMIDGIVPSYSTLILHFCSWDCCMRYAAMKEPLDKLD